MKKPAKRKRGPKGAISWERACSLAKRGQPLYRVYKNHDDPETLGQLDKLTLYEVVLNNEIKPTAWVQVLPMTPTWVYRREWFGGSQKWGWVFENYFHALAYSLKVKNGKKEKALLNR